MDQKVIDAVKFNQDFNGLPEKDGTVIGLGREVFRGHRVSPRVSAKTVELFGRQGASEISAVMGDYAMAAIMITTADQHLLADCKPLLRPR